jgi:hypothetical protein
MFREGSRGVLRALESTLTASCEELTAWAIGSDIGTYVVLNNKDTTNAATVTITGFYPSARTAAVMTLASSGSTPSGQLSNLGIYNGGSAITIGRQLVALDGTWHGMPSELAISNNSVTVTVAAATAALIQIR